MQTTITITELGVFILFLVVVGVGVYAILALRSVYGAAREITDTLSRHRQDLDLLARSVPRINETTRNAAEISRELKSRVHEAGSALGTITRDTTDTVLKVNETADQIASYILLFGEIAKAALELLPSARRS